MKRYFAISALVISLIFFWSCISFKISSILPTENQVESIHLCKNIDDSGDLLKPLDIQYKFTSKDDNVICFIRLKDIATRIHLRWKWYSPDKKMGRDTGNVIVNNEEKYLEVVTAYDMFKLNSEDNIEGQWTVVVFMNNKFIGRKMFQVNLENINQNL